MVSRIKVRIPVKSLFKEVEEVRNPEIQVFQEQYLLNGRY
jgi:hypothetical protein